MPQPAKHGQGRAHETTRSGVQLSVGFFLLGEFTLTPFESWTPERRLAADVNDRSRQLRCTWDVLSESQKPIRASCGFELRPTAHLNAARHWDYLIVVGGLLYQENRLSRGEATFLRAQAKLGVTLVGVCTGSFELIAQGLLDGRQCCVSWFHVADLLDRFPNAQPVSDRLYLDDGDRITCAGGAGAAHLGAYLVARHCGSHEAQKALRILQIDRPPARDEPQPSPSFAPAAQNGNVRRAVLIMEQHMSAPISVAAIAKRVGLSQRQLQRAFREAFGHGPNAHATMLRLERARSLLERGDESVASIALACGFTDQAHFAKRFRDNYGASPLRHRKRAQAVELRTD